MLVSDAYEADAGPGLYLTARDAFRVLLNGELVVESKEARETVFVPLTLLPGDNVLSVVVAAESGTPRRCSASTSSIRASRATRRGR